MATRKFYNTNQYIRAEKVRVIDKNGKQIGIMPTAAALEEAKKQGLDLIELATQAKPPVCKIVDFRKFIYQQRKKKKGKEKKKKQPGLKQFRLKLFIDEHDLQGRIKKATGFLQKGDRVKFNLLLRGREITKKDFGFNLLKKIEEGLKEVAIISQGPRLKGRFLEMSLEPKQKKKNDENKNKKIS